MSTTRTIQEGLEDVSLRGTISESKLEETGASNLESKLEETVLSEKALKKEAAIRPGQELHFAMRNTGAGELDVVLFHDKGQIIYQMRKPPIAQSIPVVVTGGKTFDAAMLDVIKATIGEQLKEINTINLIMDANLGRLGSFYPDFLENKAVTLKQNFPNQKLNLILISATPEVITNAVKELVNGENADALLADGLIIAEKGKITLDKGITAFKSVQVEATPTFKM